MNVMSEHIEAQQVGAASHLTETAETVLQRRYYLPEEKNWWDLCTRVADAIGEYDDQKEKFHRMLFRLDFIPNSPTLMNAGTELGQLSACFVLPIEDNLESIFDAVKYAAMVNKTGGGTGFSFSRLRPKNSAVGSTNGVASGPISFAGVIDKATDVIKQGGRRRGANMGVLRVDHPDILDFIKAKETEGTLSNFNLSVALTDEFMEAVKEGENYALIDPVSGDIANVLPAREVFFAIVTRAHDNGEPGILFIDTANDNNPTPWLGDFEATNPCGEQWLLPFESCNLGSINLGNFVELPLAVDNAEDWGKQAIDYDRLEHITRLAVRFLDNVIDNNVYPLPQIADMTNQTRKIGLGIMGLHDMLIRLGIAYDSDTGRRVAGEVMAFIRKTAAKESQALAAEKGAFPEYMQQIPEYMERRNAALTSIQPTGTVSMIADCSSGCEPYFSIVAMKHVMDEDVVPIVNKHFEAVARQEGWHSDELMKKVGESGTVLGHPEIPERWQQVFKTAMDIDPIDHLLMQAALQPHIDASISKTINMPNSATVEDVGNMYMQAWEMGCKGLTVYRDGSRDKQVLYTKAASDEKLAGTATVNSLGKAKLPDVLTAKRFRVVGEDGEKIYIIICFDDKERPVEVFAKFPFDNRADKVSKSTLWTTACRLISLALRYGVPAEEVIQQLDRSAGSFRDLPSQLSRLLKSFLSETKAGYSPECPECQDPLVFEEGCEKCPACGWSKCS